MLAGYYTGVNFRRFFALIAASAVLSACSLGSAQATPTVEIPTAVAATPTAQPPLVLLLAPAASDAVTIAFAADTAAQYSATNGFAFEQRTALTPAEIPANLAVLLILAPDPGAAELAAAAPSARVITLGFAPATPAANIVSISSASASGNAAAFIAGYIAELTAEDWRAGMLYTPATANLVEDFIAGGEYYCGACAPVAPPYSDYPTSAQAMDTTNWQAGADELLFQSVQVVYLTPELEASGAVHYFASYGVLVIGSGSPPADANNWLASINADTSGAMRQQLSDALAGVPLVETSAISISNALPSQLSQARIDNIQAVINDLLAGYIVLPSAE